MSIGIYLFIDLLGEKGLSMNTNVSNVCIINETYNKPPQKADCTIICETPVEELLSKGHSLDELIELFSDKQEQHDLYVNSALVYPDFSKIIKALTLLRNTIATK